MTNNHTGKRLKLPLPQTSLALHTLQKGAVLAISLMFLVVLTLVGIVGMKGSIMELLMAGNNQYQTQAFTRAENTIRVAELIAANLVPQATYIEDGVTSAQTTPPGLKDPMTMMWDGTDSTSNPNDTNGPYNSRYIIEFIRTNVVPGCGLVWGVDAPGCTANTFRITARTVDNAKGAVRTVQSIWVN